MQNASIITRCVACIPPLVTSEAIRVPTNSQVINPYQIKATNNPYLFGAINLPAGLSVDTATGIISGAVSDPTLTSYTVIISASNKKTGFGMLTIIVSNYILVLGNSDPGFSPTGLVRQISIDGGTFENVSAGFNLYACSSVEVKLSISSAFDFSIPGNLSISNDIICTPTVDLSALSGSYSNSSGDCTANEGNTGNLRNIINNLGTNTFPAGSFTLVVDQTGVSLPKLSFSIIQQMVQTFNTSPPRDYGYSNVSFDTFLKF